MDISERRCHSAFFYSFFRRDAGQKRDAMADDTQQQDGQNNGQESQQQQQEKLTFDKWFESQPEEVKALYEDNVHGLKSALQSTRSERDTLSKTLTKLSKEAEAGSELQKQLQAMSSQIADEQAKASFFEEAHGHGVKNLRLAYVAAKEFGLMNANGSVDFAKLKEASPELFAGATKPPPPKSFGGEGNGQSGAPKPSMNDFMRRAAGRV